MNTIHTTPADGECITCTRTLCELPHTCGKADELTIGSRIQTARGDTATVTDAVKYTGGKTRLIVRWDASPRVTQGRSISYHVRYGNSVWMSDVTAAIT